MSDGVSAPMLALEARLKQATTRALLLLNHSFLYHLYAIFISYDFVTVDKGLSLIKPKTHFAKLVATRETPIFFPLFRQLQEQDKKSMQNYGLLILEKLLIQEAQL